MGSMVDFNCRFYILDQRNSDQQLGEFCGLCCLGFVAHQCILDLFPSWQVRVS